MAKIRLTKGRKTQVAQGSGRVVKGADRTSSSSAKAGKGYHSTHLGKNC